MKAEECAARIPGGCTPFGGARGGFGTCPHRWQKREEKRLVMRTKMTQNARIHPCRNVKGDARGMARHGSAAWMKAGTRQRLPFFGLNFLDKYQRWL